MRAWRFWERMGRGRGKGERIRFLAAAERLRGCKRAGAGLAGKRLTGTDGFPVDDTADQGTYFFVDNFR